MSENERLRAVLDGLLEYARFALEHGVVEGGWRVDMEVVRDRCSNALDEEPDTCHSIYIGNDDDLGSSWICSKCTATIKEDHDWSDHVEPTGYCPGCGRKIEVKGE